MRLIVVVAALAALCCIPLAIRGTRRLKSHWGEIFNRRPDRIVRLWSGAAPMARGTEPEDVPVLRVYLPRGKTAGSAIVICPGGAYKEIQRIYEGDDIALRLNQQGVVGLVLIYRVAPRYRFPAPMLDAERAIRWTRTNAGSLRVDPHRIGIMGFSAGGHLASSVATHFDAGASNSPDPVERASSRPDFSVFGYAILSALPGETHELSMTNLFGPNLTSDLRRKYTNYLWVNGNTPPAFLFHTKEDAAVPYLNSVRYRDSLRRAGVEGTLILFEQGPHGAGLGNGLDTTPVVAEFSHWPVLLAQWLRERGLGL
jgi:acetyl esterase/lipase